MPELLSADVTVDPMLDQLLTGLDRHAPFSDAFISLTISSATRSSSNDDKDKVLPMRLLPAVSLHVLSSVIREAGGWSGPKSMSQLAGDSYAVTAMMQLFTLRAFARFRADCRVDHSREYRALDGAVVANLFFAQSSSQMMLFNVLFGETSTAVDASDAALGRDDDDVLSEVVSRQVGLWLHDVSLVDELIFQRSMKVFRKHKSIMKVCM